MPGILRRIISTINVAPSNVDISDGQSAHDHIRRNFSNWQKPSTLSCTGVLPETFSTVLNQDRRTLRLKKRPSFLQLKQRLVRKASTFSLRAKSRKVSNFKVTREHSELYEQVSHTKSGVVRNTLVSNSSQVDSRSDTSEVLRTQDYRVALPSHTERDPSPRIQPDIRQDGRKRTTSCSIQQTARDYRRCKYIMIFAVVRDFLTIYTGLRNHLFKGHRILTCKHRRMEYQYYQFHLGRPRQGNHTSVNERNSWSTPIQVCC